MQYFFCAVVQSVVHGRLDDLMKLVRHIPVLIQLHRSYLDNLKGQPFILPVLSVGALIPFQIKYNIVHN